MWAESFSSPSSSIITGSVYGRRRQQQQQVGAGHEKNEHPEQQQHNDGNHHHHSSSFQNTRTTTSNSHHKSSSSSSSSSSSRRRSYTTNSNKIKQRRRREGATTTSQAKVVRATTTQEEDDAFFAKLAELGRRAVNENKNMSKETTPQVVVPIHQQQQQHKHKVSKHPSANVSAVSRASGSETAVFATSHKDPLRPHHHHSASHSISSVSQKTTMPSHSNQQQHDDTDQAANLFRDAMQMSRRSFDNVEGSTMELLAKQPLVALVVFVVAGLFVAYISGFFFLDGYISSPNPYENGAVPYFDEQVLPPETVLPDYNPDNSASFGSGL